jgi:hypothetical protein
VIFILCIIDNLVTEHLITFQNFAEANPVARIFMNIPYGLWVMKAISLGFVVMFSKRISTNTLSLVAIGMFLVVSWNSYLAISVAR